MPDFDTIPLLMAAGLGIFLPLCMIFMRQSVKLQRQQLIADLEQIFHRKPQGEGLDQVIPSFEFVKFKYFMDSAASIRTDSTHDIPTYILIFASVPLMICLFGLGYVAISTSLSLAANEDKLSYLNLLPPLRAWNAALIVAYVGAYLFTVRDLLCSVENFDLGPARLLASALHVLFGVATAVLIAIVWTLMSGKPDLQMANIPILITAFAVGYVPELGIRALLRSSRLWLFKREDSQIYRSFKSTPLEVIDGIDSEIRSRLREFNITTVQHLATANPIMLFVETPYGIYQIFDWVAQAQLCCVVGSQTFTALSKFGIRTIFDLERAVLDSRISTPDIRREIGRRILTSVQADGQPPADLQSASKDPTECDRNVIGMVEVLIDDLHVQRLRQIYNCVTDRLGRQNTRLKFIRQRYQTKTHIGSERSKSSAPRLITVR
jgi:hypothetical protein